jgi:hypothetical protein
VRAPGRLRLVGAFVRGLVIVTVLAACTPSVSVSVTKGNIEPAAEADYRDAWKPGAVGIATATQGFQSGVCNVGGDQRGCYEASVKVIDAIDRMLEGLEAAPVPSRYQPADTAFRTALTSMRDGFQRRNHGFETASDADFVAGNDELKAAASALDAAYDTFPADARPEPRP